MNVTMRVERLREHLVQLGERPQVQGIGESAIHKDFHDFNDFSENTGPGDRDPNFTDFVQRD